MLDRVREPPHDRQIDADKYEARAAVRGRLFAGGLLIRIIVMAVCIAAVGGVYAYMTANPEPPQQRVTTASPRTAPVQVAPTPLTNPEPAEPTPISPDLAAPAAEESTD